LTPLVKAISELTQKDHSQSLQIESGRGEG